MDLATVIGLVLALFAIGISAFIGGVDVSILFKRYEAFILVFGGTVAATMISFPMKTFLRGIRTGFAMSFTEPQYHEQEIIANLRSEEVV